MVKIVDDSENKRREKELVDRLYFSAEEIFGQQRCVKGFAGNINICSKTREENYSVSVYPYWGIVTVREETDYQNAHNLAVRGEELSGREFTLRKNCTD